ncbi:transglycosylase domain-containing protein [Sinomonas sp. JGH33]|uniref:Transglycosylase domain-containing protein n=1 Tax=Sinomonas terricola TaxID=3110330 RepID=A0ABU5T2G4_9MICC|nr:transglycosylase domain-containing protein [Sinomonas sp. JGH33]MEA5453835.1 transglycosylase domain-containing protein [Sinomonas sp. JGH33]
MASGKNPLFDTATTLGKIIAFLGISAICGVLVAGLMVPAAAVTGGAANGSVQFFNNLPSELTVTPPGQVTKIVASDGSPIATLFSENRTPVKLDQMSPNVKNAIISIEDYRFYEHGGVDMTGILRALSSNLRGGRQGASTLTQQYVTNVINENLIAQGKDDQVVLNGQKGVGDKLREMKLAIALEKQMSKDQILEGYLNIVFFNSNAYGIEAASQYFFSVDAKDLTLPQAATLAGLVNSPSAYNPITNPDASTKRRNLVLDAMLEHGKIDQKQHDDAVNTPMQTKVNAPKQGCQYASQAQYFCDYVYHQLLNDPAYGPDEDSRALKISRGGLTIKTTLDPRLQGPAQAQVDSTAGANNGAFPWGASLVTVQPGTGKIVAMAQNSRMLPGQGLDYVTTYNFNVDKTDANGNSLGGLGGMQPGSTMKPVTLTAWLNEGKPTNQIVDASKRRYGINYPWKTTCDHVQGWFDASVKDSTDLQNDEPQWYRPMTVREGIYQSINTATFASAAGLNDFCDIQRAADSLGMHDGIGGDKDHAGQVQKLDMSTLGNLLGGMNVAPMTMANAFATFASNGTYCTPMAITDVMDSQGKKIGGQAPTCQQNAIKPDVAKAVTNVLQDVLTKGSGYNIKDASGNTIKLAYPDAAKTGTNNYNNQTWVVGYTKGLVTASFFGVTTGVGIADPKSLGQNVMVNGRFYKSVDGAYIAGPQWAYYMLKAAPLYDNGAFDAPPQNLIGGSQPTDQNGGNSPSPSNGPSQPATQPTPPDKGKKP